MKLLKLLINKSPFWLKGAVMALAMTGGSLVAAGLVTTPTSATSISLSITNATGCPSGSNYNTTTDICLNTADSGGLVTGSHTLNVSGDMPLGYSVTLATKQGSSTSLVNNRDNSLSIPTITKYGPLTTNTWGYSLDSNPTNFHPIKPYGQGDTVMQSDTATTQDSKTIYYGANVADVNNIVAGDYQATVQYTATAKLPPAPTVTNLILNDTILTNQEKKLALEGTGMDNVADIVICPEKETPSSFNCPTTKATNYKANNNTTIASFTSPKITNPGTYHVYASTGNISATYATLIVQEQTTCRSGDNNSDCQVDIDPNMIPVTYTGNETNPQWTTTTTTSPNWYDYGRDKDQGGPKWANAVTVKADKLSTYKGKSGVVVNNNDILGYWVYIPRYAYEVQRRDATDKFVMDEYTLPDGGKLKNDFIIKFEESSDAKKEPTPGCGTVSGSTLTSKDYRTECGLNRQYGNATGTTWATHPAFSWQSQDLTISKELNGIWAGKFETTGTRTSPTIKPNQQANISESIGKQFTMAKSIGAEDSNAAGGNTIDGIVQNSHNLSIAKTHMFKNSEWGMVTYLSASKYGAGANNTKNNGYYASEINKDADNQLTYGVGVTGCGPAIDQSGNPTSKYYDGGTPLDATTIESQTACSTTDAAKAYNGSMGQLASTTNNIYGVYDMAGGSYEMVASNRNRVAGETYDNNNYGDMAVPAKPPYVDLYPAVSAGGLFGDKPTWSASTGEYFYNNDVCTWETCGGHALHETKTVQSVSSFLQSWGLDETGFANAVNSAPWFDRGSGANNGASAGLFCSGYSEGFANTRGGFRVSLLIQ